MLEGAERELTGTAGAPYRIADPLGKIAPHYAAIVIDTRPSFSLMTEMGLLAATVFDCSFCAPSLFSIFDIFLPLSSPLFCPN